jgi:hypothetical protein
VSAHSPPLPTISHYSRPEHLTTFLFHSACERLVAADRMTKTISSPAAVPSGLFHAGLFPSRQSAPTAGLAMA